MKINVNVINTAITEAKLSDVHRGKIGAVLFTGSGKIVMSAHNVTLKGGKNFTIHAEENVIFKANKQRIFDRFPNDKIYLLVLRWKKERDIIAIAKPCEKCMYWIKKYSLKTYYSDEFGNIQKVV